MTAGNEERPMTQGRFNPRSHFAVRALIAALIGILAGGAFNAALGDQGADTPERRATGT